MDSIEIDINDLLDKLAQIYTDDADIYTLKKSFYENTYLSLENHPDKDLLELAKDSGLKITRIIE